MYKIRLQNFEGPYDLLLYFIKRDELNIYDIPIAKITEEFLKYIRLMQYFDLELAGEFLVMTATLMYIKIQMLLPKEENPEESEIEDPRTQLVQRLIEYKQFKSAAKDLSGIYEENRYVMYRRLFEQDNKIAEENTENLYKNTTLFDLIKAFKKALDRNKPDEQPHVIKMFAVSLEEKIDFLRKKLTVKTRLSFFELIQEEDRHNIVVTFLAILELLKKREIIVQQEELFDDIIIAQQPEFNMN